MLSNAPKRAVERLFEKNGDSIWSNLKSLLKALLWAFERFFLRYIEKTKMSFSVTKMSVLNNTNNNIS